MAEKEAELPRYEHQMNDVLIVPAAEGRANRIKQPKIWLTPPLWAQFVDLYSGAGMFRISSAPDVKERRERAFSALASVFPELEHDFAKLYESLKAGEGFYVTLNPDFNPSKNP